MGANSTQNEGPRILALTWMLYVLIITITGLRVVSRKVAGVKLWWDDWLAITNVAICLVGAIFTTYAVDVRGFGRHVQTIAASDKASAAFLQTFFLGEMFYFSILTLSKMSILLFYWRIFNRSSLKWLLYLNGTVVVLWYAGSVAATIAKCQPVSAFWFPERGHCVASQTIFLGISIPNILTDFTLMMIPVPFVWQLQMRTLQKLGLSLTFALGSLVAILSIIRAIFAITQLGDVDPTWKHVPLFEWSVAEAFLAPAAASLPSINHLVRNWKRDRTPRD